MSLAVVTDLPVSAANGPQGKIAFVRFSARDSHPRIYSLTLGQEKAKRLPLPGQATESPAWSPNGRLLAFVAGKNSPDAQDITGKADLYVSTADGHELRRLTRKSARVGDAAWSPDGKSLVFVKSAETGNRSSLWTMNVDRRLARRLTRGNIDLEPSWAPNGRRIAFLRIDPKTYQGAIWEVRTDGSGLHRLSRLKNVTEPIWSPDGSRLLVHDSKTIYSVRSDGTNRQAIAHLSKDIKGAVEDPQPAWSPNGTWIAFCQLRHEAVEGSDIWIVRAVGTGLHRITRSPGKDTDPSWAS